MSKIIDSDVFFHSMLEMSGYTPQTTFWRDFCFAEVYGVHAIEDTYRRAFRDWSGDVKYIAELDLVLNWKIWEHFQEETERSKALATCYDRLWSKLEDTIPTLGYSPSELQYLYSVTD